MRPVETHTKGVFIAGCAGGPKEIQVSIEQGSAAASKANSLSRRYPDQEVRPASGSTTRVHAAPAPNTYRRRARMGRTRGRL